MRPGRFIIHATVVVALILGATACKRSAPRGSEQDRLAGELYVVIGELCELAEETAEEDEPTARIAMKGFADKAVALTDRLEIDARFRERVRVLAGRIPEGEMYWIDDEAADLRTELLKTFRPPSPPAKTDVIEGAHLYARACASCHGANGEPLPQVAAQMNPPPVNLRMLARAGADFDLPWVFLVIGHGVPGTAMPPFRDTFTEQDRWNLAVFIRSMQ